MIVITIPSAATTSTIIEHLLYLNMCYRITSFPHNNPMEFGQSFPFLSSENWATNGLTILLKIKQAVKQSQDIKGAEFLQGILIWLI